MAELTLLVLAVASLSTPAAFAAVVVGLLHRTR